MTVTIIKSILAFALWVLLTSFVVGLVFFYFTFMGIEEMDLYWVKIAVGFFVLILGVVFAGAVFAKDWKKKKFE